MFGDVARYLCVTDLEFNSLLVKEHTLDDLNPFKCIETCFIAQNTFLLNTGIKLWGITCMMGRQHALVSDSLLFSRQHPQGPLLRKLPSLLTSFSQLLLSLNAERGLF